MVLKRKVVDRLLCLMSMLANWKPVFLSIVMTKDNLLVQKKDRKELTRFLGTIAHDYNWAPFTYTNCKKSSKQGQNMGSKYILPPESGEWVYETLDQSWRGFKCRLKKIHYYAYDSYEERLEHPPERVPEAHFKILLAYWETNAAKKTSLQNSENRKEQDNMHTVGPVSFVMRYDKMLRENGKAPSKREMFEETRRRKEGKFYDRPYDDTQKKIQAMRELKALQDDQNSESHKDSFDEVMGNAPGSKRLHGLGVSRKMQKDIESSTSLTLPDEVMDSIKKAVTEDVQKDIITQREEFAKEREAHAAEMERMSKEFESQASKLQNMIKEPEEPETLDSIAASLGRLRKKDPTLTAEKIAAVLVSTLSSDA
ncbi:uncharacterized protein [Spinacia oleracea]|uniref:Uncharacterized protein isoform X1 n=1 Tax=Spinacia oleracea TaxID=3562 RepID=A0ABM3RA12_SPIOL|nr:uncharacterized protein LOC110781080 isoform X1 [Spinacia oleracea]XP_056692458.1 uncharacterized protein LOC110781080 isoform X1 [Spinacia oleracea]XP_056692459.1 uncharacterized protein LOC110781080 isoform X1 [Spinacia oleracea]XP_056692460.1 uncharacterized protein LOC110781080 isoform X1 [Spinacia oleracea]XP_056692461.1 uncharacterized protein LOC110781080 isoform X1 [Spinacia oleracea]XP_056692462.1 uncharacterized protein LOC110781080 isoform X1 [Spinacia oleracea]XP_056692463.1 un